MGYFFGLMTFILSIVFFAVFIYSVIDDDVDFSYKPLMQCSTIVTVIVLVLMSVCSLNSEMHFIKEDVKPTAIDVYRGNTTLEITYKDSVAIDSTVVFK